MLKSALWQNAKRTSPPPHPKSVQSPANSLPIFSPPVSPCPPHLKNGVTFTALSKKCCQRLSQSAEKFQRVSRGNPTLVNSECYISDIAANGKSKNYLLMGFLWKLPCPVPQKRPIVQLFLSCHLENPWKEGAKRKKVCVSAIQRLPVGASNCHSPMSER